MDKCASDFIPQEVRIGIQGPAQCRRHFKRDLYLAAICGRDVSFCSDPAQTSGINRVASEQNMGTAKYTQSETEFTARETPALPGASLDQRLDEDTTLSQMTRASSVWEIDFFETRNRLAEGFEESRKEFELDRRASEVATRRLPGVKRVGRLEESLYWLFSAALLGYLLLEIIGR
jgi:hypothetical protein